MMCNEQNQNLLQLVVNIPSYLYAFLGQLSREESNKHQVASKVLTRALCKQQRDFMRRAKSDNSVANVTHLGVEK